MLGVGLGGLVLHQWLKNKFEIRPDLFIAWTAVVTGITLSLIFYLSQSLPPEWSAEIFWVLLLLPVIPFMFWGISLASFFQKSPEQSSWLYGFDIAGGALGALITVPLLNKVPAPVLTYEVVLILALAALVYNLAASKKMKVTLTAAVSVVIAAAGIGLAPSVLLPLQNDHNKDINRILRNKEGNGRVVENRWSAFGQTTMAENDQLPGEKIIYIDGAAGTTMRSFRALRTDTNMLQDVTTDFGGFFPLPLLTEEEKDSALIIGPGGGRDVLVASIGGVKSIKGVEVNRDLVEIMKQYAPFNGGLYTRRSDMEIIIDEGRNYLRKSGEKFDLIMLTLPITKSSRGINGYALTENYLFTVEAFDDYLEHLTPEGRIIFVTHGNAELYRLLSLVLEAFDKRDIPNDRAMKHIYTVARHNMPTMVIKKTPFAPRDMKIRHAALHRMGYDEGEYFVPFQKQATRRLAHPTDSSKSIQWSMFNQLMVDLSNGKKTMDDVIRTVPLNLFPVYDDNPFFYNFTPGLGTPFRQFAGLILLGIGIVIILLSVRKPPEEVHIEFIRLFARYPIMKVFLAVFLLLGAAFMMLEVALFQKLTLYLGNPVSSTSVLLFSLLLGGGLGAFSSSRVTNRLSTAISISSVSVFMLGLAYNILMDDWLESASFIALKGGLFTGLLGYAMGFPFPLMIRLLKKYGLGRYTYIMWGSNGIASVAGSVTAMIIGINWGFTAAVYTGGILYLGIAALTYFLGSKKLESEKFEPVKREKRLEQVA